MKPLRVEQRKNEPADMFLLRAFWAALPRMDQQAKDALWAYLWNRGAAELYPPNAEEGFKLHHTPSSPPERAKS
jgi:hypothetical protein